MRTSDRLQTTIRAVILGLIIAVAHGGQDAARAEEIRFNTKDGARSAILLVAPDRPAPAVMVLHGAGGTAEGSARRSGFAEAAARRGFAAVFPQGIERQWNDGRESRRVDDVGFLRRLAEEIVSRGVADPARLYIAGISNGGMMTLRMLCEASELFAAAGTIVANMPASVGKSCRPNRPVPVTMFNGTADPLVPYEGGGVGFHGGRGRVWPAESTAAFLARSNGCGEEAGSRRLHDGAFPGEAVRVFRLDWSACTSGRGVTLYRIEGGGHQVFGHTNGLPIILGRGTHQISAPEMILAAFAGAPQAFQ
jgi:polyhydroxybutyrate depolymerase